MTKDKTPEELDAAASEHEAMALNLHLQANQKREEQKNIGSQVQNNGIKRIGKQPTGFDFDLVDLVKIPSDL